MSKIAKRYAIALLEVAVDHQLISQFLTDLSDCNTMISETKELSAFLLDPENSIEIKYELVDEFFKNKLLPQVLILLKLLIENVRLKLLGDVVFEYIVAANKLTSTLDVEVFSAVPLSDEEKATLQNKLKKDYSVSVVNLIPKIDASLIGGLRLIIDNKVVDKSIKGMMETMKNALITR